VDVVLLILILALVTVVVVAVGAPLRRAERGRRAAGAGADAQDAEASRAEAEAEDHRHDDLEAAREAKYREIRDAELDYRTGKLSRQDFDAIDAELRTQAIDILNRLEGEDASAIDEDGESVADA
jgi:hypothetical protein